MFPALSHLGRPVACTSSLLTRGFLFPGLWQCPCHCDQGLLRVFSLWDSACLAQVLTLAALSLHPDLRGHLAQAGIFLVWFCPTPAQMS